MKDGDRQECTYLLSSVLQLRRTFIAKFINVFFNFFMKKLVCKRFYLFSTFIISMGYSPQIKIPVVATDYQIL